MTREEGRYLRRAAVNLAAAFEMSSERGDQGATQMTSFRMTQMFCYIRFIHQLHMSYIQIVIVVRMYICIYLNTHIYIEIRSNKLSKVQFLTIH